MSAEIRFASAPELSARIRKRELSAREVVQAHLDQIARTNPQVNAIVTLTAEQALRQAQAADEALASGAEVGPLHGLPIAHKDLHDVAGVRTTYGSRALAANVPERDSLVVERIHRAGGITVGMTNVPEFGAGSHTFNDLFGATRNPYDPTKSAGASSGGAAAALACGMHPLADGSDMGGSLRNPAAFCNVVGFRPSPGRVPSWPAAAAWQTMAVAGPMARSVADAALLLSVLAGPDARDPISLETPGSAFAIDLARDFAGLRVAWSPDLGGSVPIDPEVTAVLEPAIAVLADLGVTIVEDCPDLSGAEQVFRTLRSWQFELSLGPLLDQHPDLFKPSLAANITAGRALRGIDLAAAEALHTALFHRTREFFERYDALLLPVTQVVPFDIDLEYPTEIAGIPMSHYLDWMRSAYFISATGCPALSVPAGFAPTGLPVGLQIVGPHRADLSVLQLGHAFEQVTGHSATRPPLAM
ncbi:amidase [Nocardia sp. NPDC020380]|uniref:amidase n=1 Tax=Nocardia sp. NPDC020380 TaxID=3364309 RepID=UPI0037B6A114